MGLIANSSNEITEKIFENTIKSNELISKEEYPEILEDLKQVFQKIDQGCKKFLFFDEMSKFLKKEKENIKFVETLNAEEKEEYMAVKELLDDFNNNPNFLTKRSEEEKKPFETNEEKKKIMILSLK